MCFCSGKEKDIYRVKSQQLPGCSSLCFCLKGHFGTATTCLRTVIPLFLPLNMKSYIHTAGHAITRVWARVKQTHRRPRDGEAIQAPTKPVNQMSRLQHIQLLQKSSRHKDASPENLDVNVNCFDFLKYFISCAPGINSWGSQPLLQEQHHPFQAHM